MLILGFGNKARQGKDTAADSIREFYERKYTFVNGWNGKKDVLFRIGTFKFATALYQEVNSYLQAFSKAQKYEVVNWQSLNPEFDIRIPDWVQPDPNPEVSTLAPYGKHPKLLQWWGTDFRRAQDTEYWTNKLFANMPANLDVAMITDVRFPNEADGIKQRGGYTINVQRIQEDGTPYFSTDRPVDHPSETALDKYNWDFYIKTKEVALKSEQAITVTEYLLGLKKK